MKEENNQKKYKNISTTRLILPGLFIVFAILFEVANFLYLGFRNSSGARMAFPTYFLFDFAVILIIAAIIFAVQNKYAVCVLFCLFLAIQAGMGVVNVTMYRLFGEILSLNLIKLGNEAKAAFSFDLIDWSGTILNLALYAGVIAIGILITIFNKSTYTIKYFSGGVIAAAVLIFVSSFSTSLYSLQISTLKTDAQYESEIEASDVYLWENFQFKNEAYKKFGFYGFYTKEIFNNVVHDVVKEEDEKDYVKYIDEGYVAGDKTAPLYGDNLIVILLESIDLFAIDPIYTPTLYSMWQGEYSAAFKNFRARNRTNNSEGITLLGSMPKNTSILDAYNNGYQFDYSLPNLFKRGGDENITTTYLHPNVSTFYNRNLTHGKDGVGFDNLYTHENYTSEKMNKWGDWLHDEDFLIAAADTAFPTDKRFLTYFTTLSTHGPFGFEKTAFKDYYLQYDEHLDEFKGWLSENNFIYPEDELYQSYLRSYKAATIDLDNTIKSLLQILNEKGLSENTSILLFGDHNVYYHDLCYNIKGCEKSDFSNTYVNQIPAIFYSPKLYGKSGLIVDDYCNTYDLLPTICDLYGLASNTNMHLGHSIFSEEITNSFFASHLGGMFTDNLYSQNITEVYIRGENVTEEEIERFKANAIIYYEKQSYLEKIYFNGINGTKPDLL